VRRDVAYVFEAIRTEFVLFDDAEGICREHRGRIIH
jgi:hypothetical protein